VARLAAEGCNDHEIGRRLGVSKTTIRADRRLLGIAPHPQGQPPKSPLPPRQLCDTCGKEFQPTREHVKQGGGRFCSPECMALDPVRREASRRKVLELNAARAELLRAARRHLLTTEEVAAELGITVASVQEHVRRRRLVPERVTVLGAVRLLFEPQTVRELRRTWRDGSPARNRWLDEEFVLGVYRARGIIDREAARTGYRADEVEAVYRHRIEERARLYRSTGRPRREAPKPEHIEWAEQVAIVRAELESDHYDAIERGLPSKPPTETDVYRVVAERDFVLHPERWPDYSHAPGDDHGLDPRFQKAAGERVRQAIKRLQNQATGTS
jgi:DNA-binding CsgD family transcriptional regulator